MAESIEAMVRRYLVGHHYDGLCNPGNCGCDLGDLMACGSVNETACQAAYKFHCSRCLDGPEHNGDCTLSDGYDYVMSTDAGYCHPMYVGGDD